jgi:hypothetical protein
MALTTIGLTTLKFGTTDFSSCVVKSYEESLKCDPVELLGGDGTFKAVAISNPNFAASMTIVSGAVSGGAIGAQLTISSNNFLTGVGTVYIDSTSRTLTNDGFAETQVSAQGWTNLGQTS